MTQKELVINKLRTDGFISRNWALSQYITRLSALILTLKQEGWELEGENEKRDFYYKVKGSPFKKIIYKVEGLDKEIIKYEK